MNTMVMSVFERTREFGVLRAVGWTRARVVGLVMGEAVLISLAGAAVGLAMGYVGIRLIQRVPEVVGVFQPDYPVERLWARTRHRVRDGIHRRHLSCRARRAAGANGRAAA